MSEEKEIIEGEAVEVKPEITHTMVYSVGEQKTEGSEEFEPSFIAFVLYDEARKKVAELNLPFESFEDTAGGGFALAIFLSSLTEKLCCYVAVDDSKKELMSKFIPIWFQDEILDKWNNSEHKNAEAQNSFNGLANIYQSAKDYFNQI
jgi:hypothetical protein